MQTFLPYASFKESARVLDRQRLGKQRVECLQIMHVLAGKSTGWANHPAVKMWRGYATWLYIYGLTICGEWVSRGYADSCAEKIRESYLAIPIEQRPLAVPEWDGNEDFHRSHRSNLVKKKPEFYVPIFGDLPFEPYIWPKGRE